MEERRRFPRHEVNSEQGTIPVTTSVRVIDLSEAGVLLQCTRSFDLGARGRLRFTVGGAPFAADVEVKRVSELSDGPGYRVGATFVGMTLEHRQMLDRFMTNA